MIKADTLDAYLAKTPKKLLPIVEALRTLIKRASPGVTEAVKWGTPQYTTGKSGCYISARSDYVNLGFHRGAELSDPKGLLEGTGKGMRHIKVRSVGEIDGPAFRKLVKEAIALGAEEAAGKATPAEKRPRKSMPAFVKRGLEDTGLMAAYRERPPYQRNDYLIWITEAKREETREKRLGQMLEELKRGDVYMKMPWKAGRTRR